MKRRIEILSILAMLAWAWGLAGCGGPQAVSPLPPPTTTPPHSPTATMQEVELLFKTIEQLEFGGEKYESREPGLMVIAGPQDLAQVLRFVTPEAQIFLQGLDFDECFVVAVFQGLKSDGTWGVDIQRIVRQNDSIVVYTRFQEPRPGYERKLIETSPYQVISVEKSGDLGREFVFVLSVDGAAVATMKQFIR